MICLPDQWSNDAPSSVADCGQLVVALDVPDGAAGLVLLVQARGSVRPGLLSDGIAPVLRSTGLATCVVDLVEAAEAGDPLKMQNVDFLTDRLAGVVEFLALNRSSRHLPLAILGREGGATAAIRLAAEQPHLVRAVVSCSGRPDLAGIDVSGYRVPTLFLVPGRQRALVRANERFFLQSHCESQLAVIQDGQRIGESDTLGSCQKVIHSWCVRYLGIPGRSSRKKGRRRERAAGKEALVYG